jgi:hypothetical protein
LDVLAASDVATGAAASSAEAVDVFRNVRRDVFMFVEH